MLHLLTALEYLPIAIFFAISLILSVVIIVLPQVFADKKYNKNKLESYECGFDPFSNARSKFNIRFYLISMLFIIFDLEIAFLIPWAVYLKEIKMFGFYSMIFFLFILIIGFIYEWKKGALEWD
ncbi:NADH-ubiquinone/plastoquinone oxidoreductase, chain 3 family protein [Orientia chuto str. Dubai]|uniref:NADH-quinone oxidoreductase subunit A n=1 Tax=Orientia chuto str. Dubai TaxID=1359168 RepID=A0A0F3MLJ8_9RICK|nr:NADH-quinone oxidoreductase subunit A [Candidatus Orientia mediorientalis]KJV56628.1 NADH-ubiquinone/plastoquinone oxidoreductase, chain 3 family protein [Orientia chuto str. Dubai]